MASDTRCPVLVVGAGPSGLVLALTLRKNGIPVRIIEKNEKNRLGQRGAGIHARSMELYSYLGVWGDIQPRALPPPYMRVYQLPGGRKPIKTFALAPPLEPTPDRPFNNALMLGQEHIESILRSHLAQQGCHVELGTELSHFEQRADEVIAHVMRNKNGQETSETIICRWLVGTDGARGVVRKQLGLSFLGNTRDVSQQLVIGDIELRGLDTEYWHSWGEMRNIFIVLRPTHEGDGTYALIMGGHINFQKVATDREELERILRAGSGRDDLEVGTIRWISEYRPHERMVDRFGEGRVFVAGDAAHVHSPFGGQGLNSSIQDSFNIGWKLALVEKGLAAPSLLSTYTEERLPVIAQMLKASSSLFDQAIESKQDGSTSEKTWFRGGHLNQLGVNYRWSSIVVDDRSPREDHPIDPYGVSQSPLDPVRAGDRAPEAPGLVKVQVGDQKADEESTSLFRIFAPSYHTVLIFSADTKYVKPIVEALRAYPPALIHTVVIEPKGSAGSAVDQPADRVLVDRDGHAYKGYAVSASGATTFVIRPDGVIGAVVYGVESMRQYFHKILSGIAIA